jgi:hypothetical protein
MAGSGKTTFMHQFSKQSLNRAELKNQPFMVNLDPAVQYLPYVPRIDVRDTVDYKKVMKENGLGYIV